MPLLVVGAQQRALAPPLDHGRKLPAEVVGVGEPGVHPEASRRGEPVGGVPHQEAAETGVAERLRDLRLHPPEPHRVQGQSALPGEPHACSDDAGQLLLGEVLRPLEGREQGQLADPLASGGVVRHEDADGRLVEDEVEHRRPEQRRVEVAGEVHAEQRLQTLLAAQADPQDAPHEAARPVGRHHEVGEQLGPVGAQPHPLGGDDQPAHLVPEPRLAGGVVELGPQQSLEAVLREVHQVGGAGGPVGGRRLSVRELVDSGELPAEHRVAVGEVPPARGRAALGQDRPVHRREVDEQQLHGAAAEEVGLRVGRGQPPPLDQPVLHPRPGEEQRAEQPHRPAAHHRHRETPRGGAGHAGAGGDMLGARW